MVRHSEPYKKLVAGGLVPGRFLSVAAAEYLSGLPHNWTSPVCGSVNVQQVKNQFPMARPA